MTEPASEPITRGEETTFRFSAVVLWCALWGWMALIGLVTTCRWIWEHVAP